MVAGMTSVKLSISVPADLLTRAEQLLARPAEGRSALIARVLQQAVGAAEEAEIDAAYARAYGEHPVNQADLNRTNALARAAVRSTTSLRQKRGAAV